MVITLVKTKGAESILTRVIKCHASRTSLSECQTFAPIFDLQGPSVQDKSHVS